MDEQTRGGGAGGPGGPGSVPGMAGGAQSGPVAERMQALLSRAVEEQVSEQRQVSAVLGDLRMQIAGLADQLRGTASGDRVEQLAGDLASLTTELRRYSSVVGERLDAVLRRVDAQAASAAEAAAAGSAGTESLAVRLGALGADVASQGAALERVTTALEALGAFPAALSAVQGELAGLHDRLAPLGEVRSAVADLGARTAGVEALRPELGAVADKVAALSTSADITRMRDSLVVALGDRLERLEQQTSRPVLEHGDIEGLLAPVHERLDSLAAGGPVVDRLGDLEQRLAGMDQRLEEVGGHLGPIREAAGGVPGVATDVALVASRLDQLNLLRDDVASLGSGLAQLRDDSTAPNLLVGVTSLRQEVEDLAGRVDALQVPSADAVAGAVSGKVGDRIVDALAPRVAEVVLTRVAAVLVDQVATTVTASVQNGLTERVRAATAESERRMSAHVDEAILALAEALLRRRRPARPAALPAVEEDLTTAVPLPGVAREAEGGPADAPGTGPEPGEARADDEGVAPEPPAAEEVVAAPTGEDGGLADSAVDAVDADDQAAGGSVEDVEPVEAALAEQVDAELAAGTAGDTADDTVEDTVDDQPAAAAAVVEDGHGSHDDGGTAEVADVPVQDAGDPDDADGSTAAATAGPDDAGVESSGHEPVTEVLDTPPSTDEESSDAVASVESLDGQPDAQPDDQPDAGAETAEPVELTAADDGGAADTSAPADDGDRTDDDAADDAGEPLESRAERTGALSLRSGLRGLGLDVDDPVLDDDREVPTRPRGGRLGAGVVSSADVEAVTGAGEQPADEGDPGDSADGTDRPDGGGRTVRTAPPVRPRLDVQQRLRAAEQAVQSAPGRPTRPSADQDGPDGGDDGDGDTGSRRRPWWRPGG